MLVGVCCECLQSRIPVIYDSAQGYTIQQHPAFGSLCKGEGTAPQATYEIASGSDQMPEGVQVVNGNGLPIVKDQIPGTDTDHIPDSHSWIDSIPIGSTEGLPLFPEHNVRSPDIYPDDLDYFGDPGSFARARSEQRAFDDAHNAKHGYALSDCPESDRSSPDPECCFDPWCNHRSDPKPPGVFGSIGDLILAAKNGKQKTKKRG